MNRKRREDVYNKIRDDYFEETVFTLDSFSEELLCMTPIFGELKVEVIENEDGSREVMFWDKDVADCYIAPDGTELTEADLDMSTRVIELELSADNTIKTISNGVSFITPANKAIVLWMGSLIGKKLML